MLLCDKNSLILVLSLLEESSASGTCRESAVAQFSAHPPAAKRHRKETGGHMVLASSREAEAPGEVYHRVIMGALH